MNKSGQTQTKSVSSFQSRRGGCSTVPFSQITSFFSKIKSQEISIWHPAVTTFYQQIQADPELSSLFNDQILQSLPQSAEGRVLGNTVIQAMDLLNLAMKTSPSFTDSRITGVPFYFIFLDYLHTPEGQKFFKLSKVNRNLKNIFAVYSALLNSPQSLKNINTWISGSALKYWDPNEFQVDQTHETFGFKCWHDFFLRRFKEQCRPIDHDEDTIVSACENYPLLIPSMPVKNIDLENEFWLKDRKYCLKDMVCKERLSNPNDLLQFVGGTIYQGFLNPWTYHRWHAPVDGIILQSYNIQGYYYAKNPTVIDNTGEKLAYVDSQPYLSCTATRHVLLIDSDNKKIGKIFLILVGMVQVSTCVTNLKAGDRIKKGQYIGQFRFGGSSHCLIFNNKCQLDFSCSLKDNMEINPETNEVSSKRVNVRSPLAKLIV